MKLSFAYFIFSLFFSGFLFSQNVGVGTPTPNTSAKLDVSSNNSGFLLPRMTIAERNAIAGPATGLMVFDVEKSSFYFYNGTNWLPLLSSSPNNIPPISKSVADGAVGDSLGWSVAISGNYAIAGAPGDDIGANANQGSAYIFFKQNGIWTEQAKLTASDGGVDDAFGFNVSISGDYAVVGSYKDDGTFSDQGSAYIFIRSGTLWTQQAKLLASIPAADDLFGYSVSISGDYAVIGARSDDGTLINQGSAYVFIRSGTVWSQQANLISANPVTNESFGTSVAISGEYVAVGAPSRSGGQFNPSVGAAYIYFRTGTNWASQLSIFGGSAFENLGASISISGLNVLIGHNTPGFTSGYIYTRTGTLWNFTQDIGPPTAVAGDIFYSAISISGDNIIGGAYDADLPGYTNTGAAFLYNKGITNWQYSRRIEDNSGQVNGSFGNSVAIDGFNIITGAPGKNLKKGEVFFLNIQ